MSQTDITGVESEDRSEPSGGSHIGPVGETAGTAFWGSMPRVLTALGGLVTAIGTVAALYLGGGGGKDETPSPPGAPTTPASLAQPPAPPPAINITMIEGESRTIEAASGAPTGSDSGEAIAILAAWEGTLDAETAALVEGCSAGYAGDCEQMLEILIDECEDGYALSCDVLFLSAPPASDLEEYGDTCGGRVPDNETWCMDLVDSSSS